jgi:hypothetical protein
MNEDVARFEAFTVGAVKITVVWDMTPYILVELNGIFGGTCRFFL